MEELVIQNHSFEEAKLALKEFSEKTQTDLELRAFRNNKKVGEWFKDALLGGGIGVSHKVTGAELNELTEQIQTHLININDTQNKLIKEFGEVYTALEALDQEYIQGILASIKAAEHNSQKISQIIEEHKVTIEILQLFKERLDELDHLEDIDALWSMSELQTQQIADVQKQQNKATDKFQQIEQKIKYAYFFAGGSAALALIELFVILLR